MHFQRTTLSMQDRYLKTKSIWCWGVSSERSVIMRESANISLQNETQVWGYVTQLGSVLVSALEKQKVKKNSMFPGICLHIWGGILLVKTLEKKFTASECRKTVFTFSPYPAMA